MTKMSASFLSVLSCTLLMAMMTDQTFAFSPSSSMHHHATTTIATSSSSSSLSQLSSTTESAAEALERTKKQLEKMQDPTEGMDIEMRQFYTSYIQQPANVLKKELKARKLRVSGRKPDLAKRLAVDDMRQRGLSVADDDEYDNQIAPPAEWQADGSADENVIPSFCGVRLSHAAGLALGKANFETPTSVQQKSIPRLLDGESLLLHAETGSGKTLAYLLPITEQLWLQQGLVDDDNNAFGYGFILTPTRELAAQVAGIASVLAPPGTVRLVTQPTNLMSKQRTLKERGYDEFGALLEEDESHPHNETPDCRLFIGSAKAIMTSLYGGSNMPASPTRKPNAMYLMQSTRWLVLDEVDRLLGVKKTRGNGPSAPSSRSHERPAAIVTAGITRQTLGRAQVIAASATVGRSLKRELTRVLGLSPQECPDVIQGSNSNDGPQDSIPGTHQVRAITIPDTVRNYVTTVDTTSVGKLMTSAFFVIKGLSQKSNSKMLLVLTKNCGINTQNAVGALQHFRCQPEPQSLLDALEADGTDRMIEKHRQVSGAAGIGESYFHHKTDEEKEEAEERGYLFVTGEDSVRGLHLDGLQYVIIVGRPSGPDEYMHIAGRTGRAGRQGTVISILSEPHTTAVKTWEKMLDVEFEKLELDEVSSLD
eukprot:CAMPEP_0119568726 /NCGR_PEP_ID=MMETSP1352-20130426/39645_1 /TAXON_ID=265584 /ORGANISM="Stauroneis constricta, Strain CCMP1120" /LENGTH=650 /DNA_ID=CAMNT_0007618171 /DNA_START=60 /DNA_END=2012 /DNA_ORIENTATION=-